MIVGSFSPIGKVVIGAKALAGDIVANTKKRHVITATKDVSVFFREILITAGSLSIKSNHPFFRVLLLYSLMGAPRANVSVVDPTLVPPK